jgi:hypothetical protein
VGRLVDVHGAGELEVGRELHGVAGRQVEACDPLTRPDLHRGQEPAEVVLDTSQVHLVQDHVELSRGATGAVRGVPFARRVGDELAERRVVVEAVEGREVAQEVFVGGPAGVDRDELGARAHGIGVGLGEPGLARSARSAQDHEAAGGRGKVVAPDQVVADPERGVIDAEAPEQLREHAVDRHHARWTDVIAGRRHCSPSNTDGSGSLSVSAQANRA